MRRFMFWLLLFTFSTLSFAERKTVGGVVSISGGQLTLDNSIGGMTVSLEEKIAGAPATVSIVTQGCKAGATCTTLDTYTTVANVIRNLTLTTVYDYFIVTASWTGGTNPTVTVNYTTTTARNGGSGSGSGATTCAGLSDSSPSCSTDATLVANVVGAEAITHKDAVNGYAGLDGSTLLKATEFPTPTTTTFGGVKDKAAVANNFITSIVGGVPVLGRPTCANLSDSGTGCAATLAPVATSGSASDLGSGTLNNARLPSAITITGAMQAASFNSTGNYMYWTEATDPGLCLAGISGTYASSALHGLNLCNNGNTVGQVPAVAAGVTAGNIAIINTTTNGPVMGDAGFAPAIVVKNNAANAATSSMTLNMSAASVTAGVRLPNGAGAAPTVDGNIAQDTTTHTLRCGNGTTTTRCMVYPLITGVNGGAPLNGSTQFVKIVGGTATAATEAQTRQMMPIAGVVNNLCIITTATQSGTGNMTLTFRDSTTAANSSLVATVAAGAVAGTYCDTSNSATIVAQHDYTLTLVVNSSVPGASIEGISAIYTY